ncbi:MAG TPA: hypothetical protein VNG29_00715 [Candidatus Paceibacterota bacterium]|nr:hypothetical protein [Candidatus Paceibacterota bacterium]
MEHEGKNSAKKNRKKTIVRATIAAVIILGIGGVAYWDVFSSTIYIDQSVISAPLIALSPQNSGVLEQLFVKEGDVVPADAPVARVSNEIVKTKDAGVIVFVDNNVGAFINTLTGQGTVASMIVPGDLRVVGHLDENKGLADVKAGDAAKFTVDAFGGKEFYGVVDEVAPSSEQTDVVFNISDQRPTNQFDIYVRFDPAKYSELKNGMSARIWIYK